MKLREAHYISTEYREATQTTRKRFRLTVTFDYIVGEKSMNFASPASRHPDFGRELPRFVSEVWRMFTPNESRARTWQKSSMRKTKRH